VLMGTASPTTRVPVDLTGVMEGTWARSRGMRTGWVQGCWHREGARPDRILCFWYKINAMGCDYLMYSLFAPGCTRYPRSDGGA
jgi:hypothetical protein